MNTPLEAAANFRWNGKQWESPLGIKMDSGACSVLNEAIEDWHTQELSKAVSEALKELKEEAAATYNPAWGKNLAVPIEAIDNKLKELEKLAGGK